MSQKNFIREISELIEANGWSHELKVDWIEEDQVVRVRLTSQHPISPNEIVNDYREGLHPLEQVQQECLRALRTGSPGL
jgi:hypothetical protein